MTAKNRVMHTGSDRMVLATGLGFDPTMMQPVIGLMSGTSLDGIDAAFLVTDGITVEKVGPALTRPYPETLRRDLRAVLGSMLPSAAVLAVERDLTAEHGAAVAALIAAHGLGQPALIGFHGHTIHHAPRERFTWQIGDGAALARMVGVPVVVDFRTTDVAMGGEGAPLVPVYHQALVRDLGPDIALLNLGGVGNVTVIGDGPDDLLAFDTGPGNALLDDWVYRHTGAAFDADGGLAQGGRVDQAWVDAFAADPYFTRPAPKSLDRDHFQGFMPVHLGLADGAATLVAMTVRAVVLAVHQMKRMPRRWLVTGGGRHNRAMMTGLEAALGGVVVPIDAHGHDGDALEAQAFAYLAMRAVRGLPLSFPGTTGVTAPLSGGRLCRPDGASA